MASKLDNDSRAVDALASPLLTQALMNRTGSHRCHHRHHRHSPLAVSLRHDGEAAILDVLAAESSVVIQSNGGSSNNRSVNGRGQGTGIDSTTTLPRDNLDVSSILGETATALTVSSPERASMVTTSLALPRPMPLPDDHRPVSINYLLPRQQQRQLAPLPQPLGPQARSLVPVPARVLPPPPPPRLPSSTVLPVSSSASSHGQDSLLDHLMQQQIQHQSRLILMSQQSKSTTRSK